MKRFCAALFLFQLIFCAATAQPAEKQPYYPPRDAHRAKPKQVPGTPVVVNAASFLPGVSPGGMATIFGQNLSDVTGTVVAGTNPLPTQLADVSVSVNGILAPLFSVAYADGQDQISFQAPYETPTGAGAAQVEILNNGQDLVTIQTDSYTEDPGIFLYYAGSTAYALAVDSNYNLIGPNNPAVPGDYIVLYVTGLGPLNVTLDDGVGAPSDPPATTVNPFQAQVNGEDCYVYFSGLAPGFVAVYQLNLQLPSDLPAGDLTIQIDSQYANSGTATLPVN